MPGPKDSTSGDSVADQALAWFVRLNSGDATDQDRAEFEAWVSIDPAHRREFDKLSDIWGQIKSVADPRRVTRRRVMVGVVSAVAVTGIVSAIGLPDALTSDHYTGVGEQKSVTLSDGSLVDLDADTALAVGFTASTRRIELRRGRAQFRVAKDAERPFRIESRGGVIEALGTEFIVHQRNTEITVTVLESAVAVSLPDNAGGDRERTRIDAGHRVTYSPAGLGAVEAAASEDATAWRRGRLIFEDQPLSRVIADVNRYHRGRILLIDGELALLRVSGTFDLREPAGVIDAIEKTLPVRAIRLTPYLVFLRRR